MSDKSENSYDRVFKKVAELTKITPEFIMIDFEIAFKKTSTKKNFNTKIHGCKFHFGQSIGRKIQDLGLATFYSKNIEFRKTIHDLLNLVFTPHNFIQEHYVILKYCSEITF
jgi:hypothetical protein